jgi:hypothetical protein
VLLVWNCGIASYVQFSVAQVTAVAGTCEELYVLAESECQLKKKVMTVKQSVISGVSDNSGPTGMQISWWKNPRPSDDLYRV